MMLTVDDCDELIEIIELMKGYDHDVSSWLMLENYKKVTNNCTIIDFEVIVGCDVMGMGGDMT